MFVDRVVVQVGRRVFVDAVLDVQGRAEAVDVEEGAVSVTPEQHEALVAGLKRGDPSGLPAEIWEESQLMIGIWPKLGDEDIALAAVEDLLHRHPYEMLVWLWVPELDPIRDEPRYVAAAARLNLEGVAPRRTPSTPP